MVTTKPIFKNPFFIPKSERKATKKADLDLMNPNTKKKKTKSKSENILKKNNIKNWDELLKFKQKFGNNLSDFIRPIYDHQYNKIVDLLHHIFHTERIYPSKNGISKVRVFYPIDLVPTNSVIFEKRAMDKALNLRDIIIKRNKIWSIEITEQEIQKIYGKRTETLKVIQEKENDERFFLSKIVLRKLIENEDNIANVNKDVVIGQTKYDDNDDLVAVVDKIEYKLENILIEKNIFYIDYFKETERVFDFFD